MSRIAAHGRRAAENRPESRRFGPLPAIAGALALAACLAPGLVQTAAAQSRSGVFINNDVLNSLGAGPEAAPLAPLAPAAPATPLSPRNQTGGYQAPAVTLTPPSGAAASTQSYGSGSMVVTRPGTLLFPPLHDPKSTLTPGFAKKVDNDAARARALDNAFADGGEPKSQLLIPLESGQDDGSVVVNLDALPPADPNAEHGKAPVLTLRPLPPPAPPKPAVPASALAQIRKPAGEPAALAPEFRAPEPAAVAKAMPKAPAAPAPAAKPAPAPVVAATPAPQPPKAEATVAATPPSPTPAQSAAAEPAKNAPVSSAEVPAPVAPAAQTAAKTVPIPSAPTPVAPAPAAPASTAPAQAAKAPTAENAPVSLLPAGGNAAPATSPAASSVAEAPAAATAPAGLQTASLTVDRGVEDMTFLFEVDSAELSAETQSELRALADTLRNNGNGDIQVLGFAAGQSGSEDQARKLALSRALKVRSFLIDAGIPSTRIRVRSLGERNEGGPANRVDIKPIGS